MKGQMSYEQFTLRLQKKNRMIAGPTSEFRFYFDGKYAIFAPKKFCLDERNIDVSTKPTRRIL